MKYVEECAILERNPFISDTSLATFKRRSFRVPDEVVRKRQVAELTRVLIPRNTPSSLWLFERGIWPSSEDPFIVDMLLLTHTGKMSDGWCFGLEFEASERKWLESFAFLFQTNFWGYRVANEKDKLAIEVDHDEYLHLYYQRKSPRFHRLVKAVELIGLPLAPEEEYRH